MPTTFDMPSYEDRLATVRDRIGAALSPADRAQQSLTMLSPKMAAAPALNGTNGANATNATNAAPTAADATAGLVPNPAAYNYGRLSSPRSDLPAMVAPDAAAASARLGTPASAPVGGIDVNSYAGSRYAQPAPPTPGAGTLLPAGNPTARDAMLRTEFPHAANRDLVALGNYAYNRPADFNASMAGTRLDPMNVDMKMGQLAAERARATHEDALTATTTDQHARELGNDKATQDFFSGGAGDAEQAALAAAAKHGASASTLVDLAKMAQERAGRAATLKQQADERAAVEKDKKPYESEFGGRKAVVHNGNVTFEEPADKGMFPEPKIVTNEHGKFMQSGANQPWQQVHDDSKPVSESVWLMAGRKADEYLPYVEDFKKIQAAKAAGAKPAAGGAAAAPAGAAAAAVTTPEDKEALSWLQANPNHKSAGVVRAKLQAKGLLQ